MSVDGNEATLQLLQSPTSSAPASSAPAPAPASSLASASSPSSQPDTPVDPAIVTTHKESSPADSNSASAKTSDPSSYKLPSSTLPDESEVAAWAELPQSYPAPPQLLQSSIPATTQQEDQLVTSHAVRGLKRRGNSVNSPEAEASSSAAAVPPKRQRRTKTTKGGKGTTSNSQNPEQSTNIAEEASSEGNMGSERPRLTEQEKKNNHIASEQKRRMAIREGFDRLTEIVPGLEGQGRSESIVLKKSVDHMKDVLNERQQLIERIRALGGELPPEFR